MGRPPVGAGPGGRRPARRPLTPRVDASDVAWLRTTEGESAVQEASALLAGGIPALAILDRLRRRLPAASTRAALALADGRRSATPKFADAARLYFDREAAEQASPELVAEHTSRRFSAARRIADLGAGAGADTLALARRAPVLAVDRDTARLAMLRANVAVRRLTERVEVLEADLSSLALPDVDAVWLDPSRRGPGGRVLDPARWSPTLEVALGIASSVAGSGIKLAPGIDVTLLPEDCELEFVSLGGRLVEAVCWLGNLAGPRRRVTVLPAGAMLDGDPDTGATTIGEPGRYLFDPDPGVGRAGLIDVLASRLDAWKLDEQIAYLSGDRPVESPFVRRFAIEAWLPFSERALLDRLRSLGAGRVEVMRRGSPVETNALELRLNRALTGGEVWTVALTRFRGAHVAILGRRER
ncbi:MAG: methyltransferase domain-containing protein [Dehalococcoidia bacterium]|nr:methyltransferase domain-containing protein [Dehalococcoidia bacterium]